MHHHRVDAGLFHQHDVLAEIVGAGAGHGVAAIFHHDGLLVVLKNKGQGFDQDAAGLAPARQLPQIFLFALVRHLGISPTKSGPYTRAMPILSRLGPDGS